MSVDGGTVWATVLLVLKTLSDYNLRSTTVQNTIFDRHLQGRYAQEEGFHAHIFPPRESQAHRRA